MGGEKNRSRAVETKTGAGATTTTTAKKGASGGGNGINGKGAPRLACGGMKGRSLISGKERRRKRREGGKEGEAADECLGYGYHLLGRNRSE